MAFYTVCRNRIYHFYPLTTFGMLWVSFQDCPMVYWLPNHRHYTVLAVPCLIPKQKWFCFVLYFPWHSHPDKSGASLLPTSITCTSWFQLMFASFGWDVIPARHFPQKSLNGNPKIGSPFSPPPDHTPSYLLPLTCGLPPLYWLGIGRWCLSLVCVLHFHMSPLLFGHSCVCHCLQVCLTLLHALPCLLSFLVCGLASALAMPLHCSCYDIFYPCLLYYF